MRLLLLTYLVLSFHFVFSQARLPYHESDLRKQNKQSWLNILFSDSASDKWAGPYGGILSPSTKSNVPKPQIDCVANIRTGETRSDFEGFLNMYDLFRFNVYIPGNMYKELEIQYRFSGQDTSWFTASNNEFYYFFPRTGADTLFLRYGNGFKQPAYIYNSYDLYITPLWYETFGGWMVFLFFMILFVILIYFSWRHYVNIRKRKFDLALAKETSTLNHKLIEFQERDKENKMLISVLAHDIKGPLLNMNRVLTNVGELDKQQSEITIPDVIQKVQMTTSSLLEFIQRFLLWINIQRIGKVDVDYVNFKEMVNNTIKYCRNVSVCQGVRIDCQFDSADINYPGNYFLQQILIQNVLENSSKYASASVINVRVFKDICFYYIEIEDDGIGLPFEKVDKINNSQGSDCAFSQKSFGLGFVFMKHICQKLGGNMFVSSAPGRGLKVRFCFPLDMELSN